MTEHAGATHLFTNTISDAFKERSVQIYYYYSDDKSVAKAYHYYPSESVVGLCICENQLPIDEFTSIIFESFNSTNEKEFRDLAHLAELGELTKTNYAQQIMRLEFKAARATQQTLVNLEASKKETSESLSYKLYINCPNTFEDFLKYTEEVSSGRDPIKEYEAQYDSLHKP